MAKDPAVLFYYQDFIVGTQFMTDSDVGKYIRILCHQADKGNLTKGQVLSICKASEIPKSIQGKLNVDSGGLYYNERMRSEKEKRRNFSQSRRNNALGGKAYAQHMEDEDINKNEDIRDIDIEQHLLTCWGRKGRVSNLVAKEFVDLIRQFTKEKVFEAIEISAQQGAENIAYVKGILNKNGHKPKSMEQRLKRVGEQ